MERVKGIEPSQPAWKFFSKSFNHVQGVASRFFISLTVNRITDLFSGSREIETVQNRMLFDAPSPKFPPKFSGRFTPHFLILAIRFTREMTYENNHS
jgi:hypothetical protein